MSAFFIFACLLKQSNYSRPMPRVDFWGVEHAEEWIIFHDESLCRDEHYLYHGFLFVRRREGRAILDRLFKPYPEIERYDKEIHFTEITGMGTNSAKIARNWVHLTKEEWLPNDSIRFYVFGVNLTMINQNLYQKYHEDKIYMRFYEIALRGALGWFKLDPSKITHLFYDRGKLDVGRYHKSVLICDKGTHIESLESDYLSSDSKNKELAKFLQLTDVLLGTVRKTFATVGASRAGQKRCVDIFYEVVSRFNNSRTAYNANSIYWKKFCLSFFPGRSDITPEEFISRDLNYQAKTRDLFFCDRLTFAQREAQLTQLSMF